MTDRITADILVEAFDLALPDFDDLKDRIEEAAAAHKATLTVDGRRYPAAATPVPPPADWAAVLREAADIAESLRQFEPATGARKSAQVSENVGILRVAEELRRLAAEAQPTTQPETEAHPAEHSWAAELYDPLAEEWVPGTRYLVRDRAVNHLAHARAIGPTWKDGTPTARRLVRATTTYTVEPETEPAAGARQDGAQP